MIYSDALTKLPAYALKERNRRMVKALSIFTKFTLIFVITNYVVKIFNFITYNVYTFNVSNNVPYFEILSDTLGFFGVFVLYNMASRNLLVSKSST